jgi:hypothetical protein
MVGQRSTAAASASRQSEPDHAACYETLRAYAVARHAPASRDGLVVLLRQGVAAWMAAWSGLPAPPPPVESESERPLPLADEACAEVVHVLAAMAWGNVEEIMA